MTVRGMRSLGIMLLVMAAGIQAAAQGMAASKSQTAEAAMGAISAAAVWQVPPGFLEKAHGVCDKSMSAMSFPECFMNQIEAAGAPAAAVSFTRALYKQSDGQVGIMTQFKNFGRVDAAQVMYPLRANDNYGLLLVNGDPQIVDVDEMKMLDRAAMEADPMYKSVKEKFPQMDIWPGGRSGQDPWPRVQPLPEEGTRFIVTYPLINGCHACERVGVARYGWDFAASGKFLRTTYLPTPPPPKILPRPGRPRPGETPQPTPPSQPQQ